MEQAQCGALLLSTLGKLTHTVDAKPKGWSEDMYIKGKDSLSTSNISAGHNSLVASLHAYFRENHPSNLIDLGHRRLLLNPNLQKIGFGYISAKAPLSSYSTTQVMDESGGIDFAYEYIAYPSAKAFPADFMRSVAPWSISLNPDKYEPPDEHTHVMLKRTSDGKIWSFHKQSESAEKSNLYYHISNKSLGIPNAIIFRPDSIKEYKEGDKFEVEISGIKRKEKELTKICYEVKFFSL